MQFGSIFVVIFFGRQVIPWHFPSCTNRWNTLATLTFWRFTCCLASKGSDFGCFGPPISPGFSISRIGCLTFGDLGTTSPNRFEHVWNTSNLHLAHHVLSWHLWLRVEPGIARRDMEIIHLWTWTAATLRASCSGLRGLRDFTGETPQNHRDFTWRFQCEDHGWECGKPNAINWVGSVENPCWLTKIKVIEAKKLRKYSPMNQPVESDYTWFWTQLRWKLWEYLMWKNNYDVSYSCEGVQKVWLQGAELSSLFWFF